ncbi:MAG: L,D-transpeptidase family protein [Amphritea sp.]
MKTPLGVYFSTGRLADEQLPPRYGTGALPINYPNAWDTRQGYTGNGIWLHGSPKDTFSRPPKASEGCLSLTNAHFTELDGIVDFEATPVLIGTQFEWLDQATWEKQQEKYQQLVENWRTDWQSLNMDSYLSHYSQSFNNGAQNYDRFVDHKRKVNSRKTYINVELEDLSIYQYPDNPDLFVATFNQNYSSDNYSGSDMKRQYWVRENDQ